MVCSVGNAAQVSAYRSGLLEYCPAMPLFAADLERVHGAELGRPPLSEVQSAYLLYKALQDRRIDTTKQAVKTWWGKYRRSPDGSAERVGSVESLESRYGDSIRECIQEY